MLVTLIKNIKAVLSGELEVSQCGPPNLCIILYEVFLGPRNARFQGCKVSRPGHHSFIRSPTAACAFWALRMHRGRKEALPSCGSHSPEHVPHTTKTVYTTVSGSAGS